MNFAEKCMWIVAVPLTSGLALLPLVLRVLLGDAIQRMLEDTFPPADER